jgi:2-polyprenyl-3-methyl-5-hydroxy-6-metoxy-1,4-benzoquinol methylase
MTDEIKQHFDNIAPQYDHFKNKNWYYYKNLKGLYTDLIPEKSIVLEVGCGTGDLISHMNARVAMGIDLSPEMIKIASRKHPEIIFESTVIEDLKTDIHFDYIFLADVIEHLQDVSGTVKALGELCTGNTRIIFSYANPLWEPILWLLEKLSLKMPEGPHYRIPHSKFKLFFEQYGFKMVDRGWRLLLPANILYLSDFINSIFYTIPFIRKMGMLEYLVLKKDEPN